MKALLVLWIIAVASCNTEIQEPELEIDVSWLIKCINEVAPLIPDVIEIINLIKATDWAQVIIKAVELVAKGIPAVKECIDAFKKEINLEAKPCYLCHIIPPPGNAICLVTCSLA